MDLLVGIAAIALAAFAWTWLGQFALGRAVQAILTTAIYGAWLSIIPLSIYFIGSSVFEEIGKGSYGEASFIALISLTLIPIFILALIPWNFFCHYLWRKVGLKLPLSRRLAGDAPYQEWERER